VPRWIEELLARYNALGETALGDLRRHNGMRPSKAVFRSHGSDLLIFGEASADPIRTRGYAARRSADRCAAQAQGMSSSRREAGQRLTSFVSTSAK